MTAAVVLFAVFDLEAMAAAARTGGVRILDLESGLLERLHEIDRSALQVRGTCRVDHDANAMELSLGITVVCATVETERVLEAAATATANRYTQHFGVTSRLLCHKDTNLFGGALGERQRRRGGFDRGHVHKHSEGVGVQGGASAQHFVRSVSIVLGSVRPRRRGRSTVFDDWLPFAIYGLFSLVIPATMIGASFALATRPKRVVKARTIPFESGVSTGPPVKQRFTVSFYLTAMLFVLFDIEIVFLYPLAVILHELAWFGFLEFLVFILILLVAYVYIWRKGALEWR